MPASPTRLLAASARWMAQLQFRADQPPARPRVPLWWQHATIGSVAPRLAELLPAGALRPASRAGCSGFELAGEATAALAELALALRGAGLAHAWRDEQLAVADDAGHVIASIERAVVRPLGIATRAVHLLGQAPDGRHWVQQRALDKPDDPGLWDTLMGGMVPASDSVEQALQRETWEEAGLGLAQLQQLAYGGRLATRRPCGDAQGLDYLVESIDWYCCVVPGAVVPANRDGEVAQFRLLAAPEVAAAVRAGAFTLEAALVFAAHGL